MAHINTIIPEILDPLQFAYRPNRSTDDAISIALHTALFHLEIKEHLRENAIHWLQLSVQHHSALNVHHLAKDPGTTHPPLQLDPGIPGRLPPGGKGR